MGINLEAQKERGIRYRERQKLRTNTRCLDCGKLISPSAQRCSGCEQHRLGAGNHHWKGGRSIVHHGYVYRKMRGDPRANGEGYVAEHRVIWEEANGSLPEGWIVHHINGDKQDNRLENLEAMPRSKHHNQQGFWELHRRLQILEWRVTKLEAENVLLRAWMEFSEGARHCVR